jgi:uncharacterized membrane protein
VRRTLDWSSDLFAGKISQLLSIYQPMSMNSQLIVVAPDEVVKAAKEAEIAAKQPKKGFDFMDFAERTMKIVLQGSIITSAVVGVTEAVIALAKARQNGLNILQVSRTEAATLTFPPGHPREGTLYVAHPAANGVYFTVASFHRLAFEHKFSEAVHLLMSLGATEIRVEHVRGWSREFAANLSAPIPEAASSAELSGKESSTSSLLYEAHLSGNTRPRLPETLVWYPHEPTWQLIAKGRIEHGLEEFSLAVNYEDDFGINAGLKVTATKAGLELGGSFEDHWATTWKIRGKFLCALDKAT